MLTLQYFFGNERYFDWGFWSVQTSTISKQLYDMHFTNRNSKILKNEPISQRITIN